MDGDQAGSTRELARLALSDEWTVDAAKATGEDVAEAAWRYAESLRPLAEIDQEMRGRAAMDARSWIKPIGIKIQPMMSQEQCTTWLTSVMLALSDFPPRIITQAARIAIRTPMGFLNQVDGVVREEAEKIMRKHRRALFRLERLRDAIAKANEPCLPAPNGFEDGAVPPMTVEDIAATARSPIGIGVLRMGLAQGYIDQIDFDAAMAACDAPLTSDERPMA